MKAVWVFSVLILTCVLNLSLFFHYQQDEI